MAARTPTEEQQQAIDLFAAGSRDLVIKAGAGTGKTTTLAMMARTTPRKGMYLAFNRAIATDAARAMPMTVESRTVHSVAMRGLRRDARHSALLDARLGGPRVARSLLARQLGLGLLVVTLPGSRQKVIQPSYQAGHIERAIAAFCQSGDPEPDRRHFPYIEGIDPHDDDGRRTFVNNRQVAKELEPALRKAWADLQDPRGHMRFTHDVYLKMAQLANVPIPGDYLLFDEAQDASGVMLAWLAQQSKPTVYVGDSQQQIYEWRGAVDAMERLGDDVPRAYLTRSWRFGPEVADVANAALAMLDADLRLEGTPTIPSRVHRTNSGPPPRAVLCRSNGAAVNAVLSFQAKGMSPHLVGGAAEIVRFARAAADLQAGQRTTHPELACFDTWREVQEYVERDPAGSDLRMLVNLLDKYGIDIVVDALDGLLGEDAADVVISTAHKAKGREWPAVRLAADFEVPDGRDIAAPEWRLLYVAATRATHHLDISSCEPLRDLMEDAPTCAP